MTTRWLKTKYNQGIRKIFINAMGIDLFPLKKAQQTGFKVKWLDDYCSDEVAEHGWNMFIKLKRIRQKYTNNRTDKELSKQNALVIGSEGRIGKKMVKKLKYYFRTVLTHDTKVNKDRMGYELKLRVANAIFLCIPLNNETRKYFTLKDIRLMKRKPFIVNVSGRLGLLSAYWAYKYIKLDWIKGYACDERPENPMYTRNVFMLFTSHIGWKSEKSIKLRKEMTEKLLKSF